MRGAGKLVGPSPKIAVPLPPQPYWHLALTLPV